MNSPSEHFDEIAESVSDRISNFVISLSTDGERAAVILAAAQIDTILDEILRRFFRPCAGGSDDLFDNERPLSTFSAKITAVYRLGLIDQDLERAIQLVRKIRNEFAHSHDKISLTMGAPANRLLELKRSCEHIEFFQKLGSALKNNNITAGLRIFVPAIGVILIYLSVGLIQTEQYESSFTVGLKKKKTEANQSLQTTTMAVTDSAAQTPRQP